MFFFRFITFALIFILVSCTSNNSNQKYKSSNNSFYGGIYKIGDPYLIDNKVYYPKEEKKYDEIGIASWYGKKFHGKPTANGETFNMYKVSAAHKTLPLPSQVKVTNLDNNKSLIMRVNDRGPFAKERIIDLSMKAAELLGFKEKGTQRVRVQYFAMANIYDQYGNVISKRKYINQSNVNNYSNKKETYSLVIGSFTDIENVNKIKQSLKSFTKLNIEKKEINNNRFYKLSIGPYYRKEYIIKLQETINFIGIKDTKIVKNEN